MTIAEFNHVQKCIYSLKESIEEFMIISSTGPSQHSSQSRTKKTTKYQDTSSM
jgi:hypothetical protein